MLNDKEIKEIEIFRKSFTETENQKKEYISKFKNKFINRLQQLKEKVPELKEYKIKEVKDFGKDGGFIEIKFEINYEDCRGLQPRLNDVKKLIDGSLVYIHINKKNLTNMKNNYSVIKLLDKYINNPSSFKEEFLNKNMKYFDY